MSESEENSSALANTLHNIANGLPWLERLDLVVKPAPGPKDADLEDDPMKIDPNDDFKRENYFYRLAQSAVLMAIPKLHELNVPTKRPTDYFAEMVKSDEQMGKVKQHLVETQQRLSIRERAREMRENRKLSKQTKIAVQQVRKGEKQKLLDMVKASRKKTGKDREEMLADILDEFQTSADKKGKKNQASPGFKDNYNNPHDFANRRKVNKKRDFKNKKFGHGGQKKRSKRNDSASFGFGKTSEIPIGGKWKPPVSGAGSKKGRLAASQLNKKRKRLAKK